MLARSVPARVAVSPRSIARRNTGCQSSARNASSAPVRPRARIGKLAGAATGLGASLALFGFGRADDSSSAGAASSKAAQPAAGAWTRPVWKRDEVSTTLVIGAPKSGASTVAEAIRCATLGAKYFALPGWTSRPAGLVETVAELT